MRRIQPPKCSICTYAPAAFESGRWATLKLCIGCWKSTVNWFIDEGLAHGNPIVWELVDGTDNGVRDDAQRFWRPVVRESSTYYEYWVLRETPESRIVVDNSLDFLDDL